ncbi:hypothetical protein NX821_002769 [Clostridium septicum]|uniref:imm11 family protein n=1 Tax=Clostridium septicum TaxID=1504 RepID=UPI000834DE9B|nr:DUF1629 domain-containing protein [Clostridium septicum]WLF69097.1 hypothetical protein Q6375_14115 [Clostridium septicum]
MKIWKIDKNVNDFAGFFLKNKCEMEMIEEKFYKGNFINEWSTIEIVGHNMDRPLGDCSHLWSGGNHLLVSEKAKEILSERYKEHIQFLPMIYNGTIYYIDNILNIFECIDYEKSELKILSGKYIVDVNKYVFKDNVKKVPIFKIYLDGVIKRTDSFVNDEFKKLIEDSGLEGFKFTEVFDFKA